MKWRLYNRASRTGSAVTFHNPRLSVLIGAENGIRLVRTGTQPCRYLSAHARVRSEEMSFFCRAQFATLRSVFLLLAGTVSAGAQSFSFGVKGGVPLTEYFSSIKLAPELTFEGITNRYIVGPEVQINLPFGFAVEADGLYRHFHYATSSSHSGGVPTVSFASAHGSSWEIPLLGKYRSRSPVVRPYVEAGVAWDRLAGLSETITEATPLPGSTSTFTTSTPRELRSLTVTGFVAGGGIDLHALFLHIAPEVRYTHWTGQHFQTFVCAINCGLAPQISNQNQVELLVGITL